jgi:hypothetical protein
MTRAMIIENGESAIGIAVEERHGFFFYAAEPQYHPIDAKFFRSFKELRRAAAAIEEAVAQGH